MILAEKITEARKKNGWSQEEMAEKLSVSRQAVSKWESAQSTPDLQKVLRLAEIFGVSTDYLLKDELKSETGTEILEYAAEESSVRSVSMEEANAFMEWRRKTGPTLAGAVALCIISPALLIFLAGLSDSHIENISENMATGAGISVLLLLVAAAVVIFVSYSIHGQQYEYLEKERIETAYGVTGLVQERKKDYESTFTRGIAAGVTLCILAVIPMFAAIAFSQPDYIITATVSILLLLVAVGVFFIVRVSTIMEATSSCCRKANIHRKKNDTKRKQKFLQPPTGVLSPPSILYGASRRENGIKPGSYGLLPVFCSAV